MRISIVLILVVAAIVVNSRPHNDGTDHTHSPVIAPDSESIINIDGRNEAAVHHSDVGLGNFSISGQTDMSHIKSKQPEIEAAETHHSDTYMSSNKDTSNPKPQVSTGHAPTVHVDHSGISGGHPPLEGEIGSVVSHGPLAKNVDNHEMRHNHDHEHGRHGHHDKHSTVNHAPMATEHHSKTGNAHHPQLSKTEPAIAHSPMVHPEGNQKTDKTDDSINEHRAVTSTVNHPPLATDHHPPNTMLAHHPSLSKIDVPMSHAFVAISHGDEKTEETGIRKKRSGPGGLSTHPKTPPRESIEEYQDSEESEYPSKEDQYNPSNHSNLSIPKHEHTRQKRAKGSNQKSYARKTTTTTTTTTTLATPTELASSYATELDSSEENESKEEHSEGAREKRSKGSNQKTNVKRLTTTTTTTTTTPPAPITSKEVFEASHRGSSEEQDSREQRNKKPEVESEFREKRSKGSNRKPAAYTRTTVTSTTSTDTPITKHSSEATGSSEDSDSHAHKKNEGESEETQVREKRSKGSNQKSYARKTTTTTTTTTVAPTTQEASNPASSESSEEPEDNTQEKPEETEGRSKRSKGSNHSFAKKPLTTHNYPTVTSTISTVTNQDATDDTATELSVLDTIEETKSDDLVLRVRRSKGNYQKTQPRKTTTTTTTAKPSTSAPSTLDVSESVSMESSDSSSFGDVEVTSEKSVREKRSKGSNQNSYAKKHHITTTLAPKAPEPEAPVSNVHHPSLSKTEPLNPAKPEEPIKMTKPNAANQVTAPEPSGKYAQPPQIIPGSHPLAIPLPTNPPPS